MASFTCFCILALLFTGALSQTCDQNKLNECKAIKDSIMNQVSPGQDPTQACNSQQVFSTCIAPCKTLAFDSPLFLEYTTINAEVTGMLSALCPTSGSGSGTDCIMKLGVCSSMMGSNQTDMSQMCMTYESVKQCLDNLEQTCKDVALFQTLSTSIKSQESICTSGCSVMKIQSCMQSMDVSNLEFVFTKRDMICQERPAFMNCVSPLQEPCQKSTVLGVAQALKSIDMIQKVTKVLCVTEAPNFAKQSVKDCYKMPDLTTKLDKCGDFATPTMGKDETEKQQCQRIADHTACVEKVTSKGCKAEATTLTSRVGDKITRIVYQSENVNCPTGGAGHLGSSVLMLVVLVLGFIAFL